MVIPNPTYPAITSPQGSSSLLTFPDSPDSPKNKTRIGVSPNDTDTKLFMDLVELSPILQVSGFFLHFNKQTFRKGKLRLQS